VIDAEGRGAISYDSTEREIKESTSLGAKLASPIRFKYLKLNVVRLL